METKLQKTVCVEQEAIIVRDNIISVIFVIVFPLQLHAIRYSIVFAH